MPFRSVESEHCQKGCVDLPLLFDRDSAHLVAQTAHVDAADLFDEDACVLAVDDDARDDG